MAAIKQMAPLTSGKIASDKTSAVKLTFDKNRLAVSANTAGLGSGETEIEIEYSGEQTDINFNPNYVKDILQNIEDANVQFSYTTSQNPVVLTPESNENYICVVMPMR